MAQRDDISNTFAAINYINLSKSFNSNESNDKINIKKVWDVVLNPTKYEDQINDLLENKIFSKIFFKILDSEDSIYQPFYVFTIIIKFKTTSPKHFSFFSQYIQIIIKFIKSVNIIFFF